jgi:photosystem II stability/assembly factor-like uncharacterized protein
MRILTLLFALFFVQLVSAQYKIEVLDSNTFTLGEGIILSKTSFRGLSVVDDKTIWVSGSRGTFARSLDGGKTFTYTQLKGYGKSDFRDIEAFDANNAVMMSPGTPAYILTTNDGGNTWKEAYKNTDTAYFLDAMDFWDNKRGVIVGDPINKHFVLLHTEDGGNTWKEMDTTKTPTAIEGEAVFAASGTSLRCWGKDEVGFVSGGYVSRFYISKNNGEKWKNYHLPIIQGNSSKGCFSFAIENNVLYFIGGDYQADSLTQSLFCYSFDEGKTFSYDDEWLGGYQSCIEIIPPYNPLYNRPTLFATGTRFSKIGH